MKFNPKFWLKALGSLPVTLVNLLKPKPGDIIKRKIKIKTDQQFARAEFNALQADKVWSNKLCDLLRRKGPVKTSVVEFFRAVE